MSLAASIHSSGISERSVHVWSIMIASAHADGTTASIAIIASIISPFFIIVSSVICVIRYLSLHIPDNDCTYVSRCNTLRNR